MLRFKRLICCCIVVTYSGMYCRRPVQTHSTLEGGVTGEALHRRAKRVAAMTGRPSGCCCGIKHRCPAPLALQRALSCSPLPHRAAAAAFCAVVEPHQNELVVLCGSRRVHVDTHAHRRAPAPLHHRLQPVRVAADFPGSSSADSHVARFLHKRVLRPLPRARSRQHAQVPE